MRCERLQATISEWACVEYRKHVRKIYKGNAAPDQCSAYHPCLKCPQAEGKQDSYLVKRGLKSGECEAEIGARGTGNGERGSYLVKREAPEGNSVRRRASGIPRLPKGSLTPEEAKVRRRVRALEYYHAHKQLVRGNDRRRAPQGSLTPDEALRRKRALALEYYYAHKHRRVIDGNGNQD